MNKQIQLLITIRGLKHLWEKIKAKTMQISGVLKRFQEVINF